MGLAWWGVEKAGSFALITGSGLVLEFVHELVHGPGRRGSTFVSDSTAKHVLPVFEKRARGAAALVGGEVE